MNTSTLRLCISFFTVLAVVSCKDQGNDVEYLEITEIQPAPNSTQVDKAARVYIRLNRNVNVSEAAKIQIRYVDGSPINYSSGLCDLIPPIIDELCSRPHTIWIAGKTVEVSIRQDLSDLDGNSLRQPLVYRFTVVRDTIPFDLLEIIPGQSDTISLSQPHWPHFRMVFNDYLRIPDSVLTVDPPARLSIGAFGPTDTRRGPQRDEYLSVRDLLPYTEYTVTIPRTVIDFEGEMLPRAYHVVFYTRP